MLYLTRVADLDKNGRKREAVELEVSRSLLILSFDVTFFMLTETIWLKKLQIFMNSVTPS
jgi:hypothetical protein